MANIEILKDSLSEETYNAVEAELKDKDLKLADLSGGAYVSAAKYNAMEKKWTDTKAQLDSRSGLEGEIEELKSKSKQQEDTIAQYESRLKTAAVRAEIVKAAAKDPADILPLLDMTKITVEDEAVSGLTEQLTAIKEKKAYLFSDGKKAGASGLEHDFGKPNGNEDLNAMRRIMGLPPVKE